MSEITICPRCGSADIHFVNLDMHPSIHCRECNVLVTQLTSEQLESINEQCKDMKEIRDIIEN